jgi:hypothetical protein
MPDPTPPRRHTSLHLRSAPTPSVPGYHVLERLGNGRNGTVYRAIQLSMQREVALRVLDVRLGRTPGFAERFMQEARSAGGVHHANTVACYDVGQADGLLYQAMELITGRTLAQVSAQHPQGMDPGHALGLLVEAARGLEGIHRCGLVHGDLRLGNLFITDDEVVKLADYGLVRSLEVLRGADEQAPDLATLAPEQFAGSASDIRADLYGLGAVLYVLLTGRQPFAGRTRRDLERAVRTMAPTDPRTLVAGLSDDLAAVIAKAMARSPAERYATPAQLREDLERVQYEFVPIHALPLTAGTAGATISSPPREAPAPTRTIAKDAGFLLVPRAEPARDWRLPAIGIAGAVVVVVGLLGWSLTRGGGVDPPATTTPPPAPSAVAPVETVASTPPVVVRGADWPAWAGLAGSDQHGRWADLTVRGVTFRLRHIQPGRFVMGSLDTDPAHRPDEKAVQVTLTRAYWLADTEVTQAQFRAITGDQPSGFRGDDLPVENLTWHDCVAFAQRLNALVPGLRARLPTEAEWEYACRAGNGQSSQPGEVVGWFSTQEVVSTRPVKGLPPNAWGLYDMLGNVMEWCQDHYGPYPTMPARDPLRVEGISRVVRGGSWAVDASEGRPSRRGRYLPVAHHAHVGFRIVIDE